MNLTAKTMTTLLSNRDSHSRRNGGIVISNTIVSVAVIVVESYRSLPNCLSACQSACLTNRLMGHLTDCLPDSLVDLPLQSAAVMESTEQAYWRETRLGLEGKETLDFF